MVLRRSGVFSVVLVLVAALLAAVGLNAFFAPAAMADTAAAAGEFVPLAPARIVDTRSGLGGSGALGAAGSAAFQVTGQGGVPSSGVSAVAMTVTGVAPSANSYLQVWPSDETRPSALSQVTLNTGVTTANTVISKVSGTGKVSVYNNAGSADVLIDITGYYTNSSTTTTGGTFVALTPARAYDSRATGESPIGAGATKAVQVTGLAGVPSSGVSAVVVNITGVGATADTYFSVWGAGSRPTSTVLNLTTGVTAGAMAQTGLTSAGQINIYNNRGTADVIVDVEGYYRSSDQDAASYFVPVSPARVYSTVTGQNAQAVPVGAQSAAAVQIRGAKNGSTVVVPNDKRITAVVVSITAAGPAANGFLTAYPQGVSRPNTSILNYTSGATVNVTGTAIVKLSASGQLAVWSYQATDVIVDVQGYFQANPPPAPPAPAVSSSSYPSNGWAASGTAGTLSVSVSGVTGPGVRKYLWSLDDPAMTSPTTVTVGTDNATGTISLPAPADGWHTLSVQAVNTAGNPSPVTTYSFGTGVAVTAPATGATTARFARLAGKSSTGFNAVTWKYRRASTDPWATIPTGDVTNNGATVSAWPVTGTTSGASFTPAPLGVGCGHHLVRRWRIGRDQCPGGSLLHPHRRRQPDL